MSYKETPEEIANEEQDDDEQGATDGVLSSDEELEFDEEGGESAIALEGLDVGEIEKSKTKTYFSLKARRAIEDHLEKRRLRKELDYLFDDGFAKDKDKPKES